MQCSQAEAKTPSNWQQSSWSRNSDSFFLTNRACAHAAGTQELAQGRGRGRSASSVLMVTNDLFCAVYSILFSSEASCMSSRSTSTTAAEAPPTPPLVRSGPVPPKFGKIQMRPDLILFFPSFPFFPYVFPFSFWRSISWLIDHRFLQISACISMDFDVQWLWPTIDPARVMTATRYSTFFVSCTSNLNVQHCG